MNTHIKMPRWKKFLLLMLLGHSRSWTCEVSVLTFHLLVVYFLIRWGLICSMSISCNGCNNGSDKRTLKTFYQEILITYPRKARTFTRELVCSENWQRRRIERQFGHTSHHWKSLSVGHVARVVSCHCSYKFLFWYESLTTFFN